MCMCVGVALSPVEHYGRPPRIFFSSPLHICQRCSTCHNTCRLFLHTRVIYSLLVFFLHRFLQLSLSFTLLFQKKRSHVICKHTYTTHTHTHTKVRQQHQQQRYSQRQSLFLSSQQHTLSVASPVESNEVEEDREEERR